MIKPKEERASILDRELKKHIEQATLLEIEIAYQKQLDPSEMSAKKVKSYDLQGRPQSVSTISRGEYVEIKEKELEQKRLIIETIKSLY